MGMSRRRAQIASGLLDMSECEGDNERRLSSTSGLTTTCYDLWSYSRLMFL